MSRPGKRSSAGFGPEGFDVCESIFELLKSHRNATTEQEIEALRNQFQSTEDRAVQLLAETRAFNRWNSKTARAMKGLPREERLNAFRKVYRPKSAQEYRDLERNRGPAKWDSKLVNVDERWSSPAEVRILVKDFKQY